MSLSILSTQFECQEKTYKSVAFASLNANLNFYTLENSLKDDSTIEIWVKRRYGNGEDDYDVFSMDIHNENWATNSISKVKYQEKLYYTLAGTDNTPSTICYYFSLAYLKLNPLHKIALYDNCVFGIEEIEKIETRTGYTNDWSRNILN
jgi:hypothetical protein